MVEMFAVALPDHRLVFCGGIPDLTAVQRTAFVAENTPGEAMRRIIPMIGMFALGKLCLHGFEHFRRNDGGMTVFNVILRNLALVHLHFLGQEIRAEGLLQDGVALVFLVG